MARGTNLTVPHSQVGSSSVLMLNDLIYTQGCRELGQVDNIPSFHPAAIQYDVVHQIPTRRYASRHPNTMHSDTAAYMEPEAGAEERHCRLYTRLLTSSPPLLKEWG